MSFRLIKIKTLFLSFCLLLSQVSYGAAVSTYDINTLDVVIAKVTTLGLGLGNEQTFYNVELNYNSNTFFWELGSLDSFSSKNQGEATAAQYEAFGGTVWEHEICDTTTQSLCFTVTFRTQGFTGSGIFGLNFAEDIQAVNPTHPIGGWKGSAVDTQCGGSIPNFSLASNSDGVMSGTAVDTEGTEYVVIGSLSTDGMSLEANDGFGVITMACPLDSTGSSCSGTWTGAWPAESLNCGGTFQLNRQ